jgi:TM2 domain-containing membrane protein YozV
MSGAVCPYCRAPIDGETAEQLMCAGCGTLHHSDCYAENGGCTIFGCRCAPPEEPKVAVSAPDLMGARMTGVAGASAAPAFAGTTQGNGASAPAGGSNAMFAPYVPPVRAKSKITFIMLGLFLGAVGGHNFYAGYNAKAIIQLCLTVFTIGYGSPMAWIWAVIEICIVDRDSKGIQFSS